MDTNYPIVLVHGVLLKDFGPLKAWGSIDKALKKQGITFYNADHDGFGSIENNAAQIKPYIEGVLVKTGAERVNIITHSKGGLDTLYMIDHYGMQDKIASITFVSTPHRGSAVATFLYRLPRPLRKLIEVSLNLAFRLLRDKNPDSLTVCRQLCATDEDIVQLRDPSVLDSIYLQSYSVTLKHGIDDFVMSLPLLVSHFAKHTPGDGMVAVRSAKYGVYRGDCTGTSVSHSEIAGFMLKPWKKKKVHRFYISVVEDLAVRGL